MAHLLVPLRLPAFPLSPPLACLPPAPPRYTISPRSLRPSPPLLCTSACSTPLPRTPLLRPDQILSCTLTVCADLFVRLRAVLTLNISFTTPARSSCHPPPNKTSLYISPRTRLVHTGLTRCPRIACLLAPCAPSFRTTTSPIIAHLECPHRMPPTTPRVRLNWSRLSLAAPLLRDCRRSSRPNAGPYSRACLSSSSLPTPQSALKCNQVAFPVLH